MSVVAIDQRQFVLDKFYTEHGLIIPIHPPPLHPRFAYV